MRSTVGLACNTETTVEDYSEDATAITPLIVGTEQPDQTGDDDEGTHQYCLSHAPYQLTCRSASQLVTHKWFDSLLPYLEVRVNWNVLRLHSCNLMWLCP